MTRIYLSDRCAPCAHLRTSAREQMCLLGRDDYPMRCEAYEPAEEYDEPGMYDDEEMI